MAIRALEHEASGRWHELKSQRAGEVRKSALMAVSSGPEEARRKHHQGFGHRYPVEMIPNEMLFRGRDDSAWAQDLKPIPMLLGHGASQVEWGEHGKADRDSPESCGWRRGIGSRLESGGGRRNGDIPARRWRTPDASTGPRNSCAAGEGAAGRTLRLPAGGNNPNLRNRRGEGRERSQRWREG